MNGYRQEGYLTQINKIKESSRMKWNAELNLYSWSYERERFYRQRKQPLCEGQEGRESTEPSDNYSVSRVRGTNSNGCEDLAAKVNKAAGQVKASEDAASRASSGVHGLSHRAGLCPGHTPSSLTTFQYTPVCSVFCTAVSTFWVLRLLSFTLSVDCVAWGTPPRHFSSYGACGQDCHFCPQASPQLLALHLFFFKALTVR